MNTFKTIHIGQQIKNIATIKELSISRACQFLKCSAQDIEEIYEKESLDSDQLLRWCKLLDYNFFMFYHSHLQLYSPSASIAKLPSKGKPKTEGQSFKKNLYSPEIIDYILKKLKNNELSAKEIMEVYHIPRTTLYRWKKKSSQLPREVQTSEKKKVNYKALYTDFITHTPLLKKEVKLLLLEKISLWENEDVNVEKLYKINQIIQGNLTNSTHLEQYKSVKAYDESYMRKILSYQKEYSLSDLSLSKEYKFSRNTIVKWKKQLEDIV